MRNPLLDPPVTPDRGSQTNTYATGYPETAKKCLHFPHTTKRSSRGKIDFSDGKNRIFRGKIDFSHRKGRFLPRDKTVFSTGKIDFPTGKIELSSRENQFSRGKSIFPVGKAIFPMGNINPAPGGPPPLLDIPFRHCAQGGRGGRGQGSVARQNVRCVHFLRPADATVPTTCVTPCWTPR